MPHRLREARRLAGLVPTAPVSRPSDFGDGDAGFERTSWPAPRVGTTDNARQVPPEDDGLLAEMQEELSELAAALPSPPETASAASPEDDGLFPAEIQEELSRLARARVQARASLPESASAAPPEDDGLFPAEIEKELSELARARVRARSIDREQSIDSETVDDDAPPAATAKSDPGGVVELADAIEDGAIVETDASDAGAAEALPPDAIPTEAGDAPAPVGPEPEAGATPHEASEIGLQRETDDPIAAGDPPAEEPASAEAAPLPEWRMAGSRNGSTHGEEFLVSIRSVLDGAKRHDCQMSAALIDLHLDLVVCANGKRPEIEAAAEEVREAGIEFFAALLRDGSAEAERASAEAATDRLQASLAA